MTNSGTRNIEIESLSLTGPSAFTLAGWTGEITLTPGHGLHLAAVFDPTTQGSYSGTLTVHTNTSVEAFVTITGAGAGVATTSTLGANPGSVAFGSVVVGTNSSQTIMLTNSGNTSVTISQASVSGTGFSMSGMSSPMTLTAGQSTSLSAVFNPAAAGSASGTITVSSNASDPTLTIALSGTGAQGQLSASPASVNFGSVVTGASDSVSVTLTNSGTAGVTISQASASGTGFSMSGLTMPQTLGPNASASFTAKFAPTSAGNASGSVSLTSSAPGSPLTITLSGTGTQAQLSATPSSVSFGNVVTGNTNSQTITLKNSGSASVTISQASVSGTGFRISGTPTTIAAGGSTSFSAAFAPTSAGSVSGSVSLVNSGPNSPLGIPLSGTGVAATQVLGGSPTTLSFGNVNEGTSTSQSVTLTNNGNSNVTISSIGVTGAGFSGSGVNSGLMLSPNQTAALTITFDPSSGGPVTGTVTIASNATNSPATVSVSGTGIQPHSVLLTWTASTSSDVVSYNVYRGTSPGSYSKIASSVGGTPYTDTTVQSGQNITYYYAVTAVDSSGDESTYSNQATATVP